ncbi:MAG: hypothetical protein U0230_04815 [Polyangiales bacterium]
MDAVAHPRLSRYLRSLPDGLLSHPECEGKASMYREALAKAPKRLELGGLPPLLADYVTEPVPMSSWIPEVINSAVYLAIADQMFKNDDLFLEWVGKVSDDVFQHPAYRVLMVVASPQRLANGAERRWAQFHTGTSYEAKIGSNGVESKITYPDHLFDRLVLRASARAIQSAYRASGAKTCIVEVTACGTNEALLRSIWDPSKETVAHSARPHG